MTLSSFRAYRHKGHDLSLLHVQRGHFRSYSGRGLISFEDAGRKNSPMNLLGGCELADLRIGMSAIFAKTITEADIVLFAGVVMLRLLSHRRPRRSSRPVSPSDAPQRGVPRSRRQRAHGLVRGECLLRIQTFQDRIGLVGHRPGRHRGPAIRVTSVRNPINNIA